MDTPNLIVSEKQNENVTEPINESAMEYILGNSDLLPYEKMLQEAVIKNSNEKFPNSDKYHAAIAMSVLFDAATTEVCLVVNSFAGDVSNDKKYNKSLEKCLKRGVAFRIITLEEPTVPNSEGYKKLYSYKEAESPQVKICKATDKTKELLSSLMLEDLNFNELHNFALCDSNKYRLEFYPSKYMAILSFNDPNFVATYSNKFNEAFAVSSPIN